MLSQSSKVSVSEVTGVSANKESVKEDEQKISSYIGSELPMLETNKSVLYSGESR